MRHEAVGPVIARVDAFPIAYPEPHYRGVVRYLTLVRIETRDGVVGWGEANVRFREAALATQVMVDEGFAPRVVGRDPLEGDSLWRELCEYSFWFGVEGIAAFAISAIDMALWDVRGKLLGRPVADLLGGQRKSVITATATIILDMDDLDWTLSEFQSFREDGYRIVKGGGGLRPEALIGQDRARDVRYLREIRGVIGDEVSLIVDIANVHGRWDTETAIEWCRDWEQFDLRWVEQPLLPADLAGYARLRSSVATPIGSGEDEWSPEAYARLIESAGVDVVQVDPGRCLGITGCRRVVSLVEASGLRYSAHSWSSALNTAASLHILAISDSADTLDFKPHPSVVQHELVADPWVQHSGELELRAEPGLGVTVLEDVVDRLKFA
jgi:L-alanine-DL-glutamate epimerase-like enolase superfamily enzyme